MRAKHRRTAAPKTRKEAAALQREKAREQRRLAREGLLTGDARRLPARDAGPAKQLARDIVDSHFTYGQVFFGLIVFALILGLVPSSVVREIANFASLAGVVLIISDGVRNGRMAKRMVTAQYGDDEARGITFYAVSRSMLPRRFRRPPPQGQARRRRTPELTRSADAEAHRAVDLAAVLEQADLLDALVEQLPPGSRRPRSRRRPGSETTRHCRPWSGASRCCPHTARSTTSATRYRRHPIDVAVPLWWHRVAVATSRGSRSESGADPQP